MVHKSANEWRTVLNLLLHDNDNIDKIVQLIKEDIQKGYSNLREPLSPTEYLAVTLR